MSVITPVTLCDSFSSTVYLTLSPTATGLVVRIPFMRNLPLIRQSITSPLSVFTEYQLPVERMTNPFSKFVQFLPRKTSWLVKPFQSK